MMPLRRWVTLVILVVVVIVGVTWLRNENALNTPKPQPSVAVNGWSSGIGAVSSSDTGFDKQKMSFSATIWNNTNRTVYVTNVRVKLPSSLLNHVLSGSTLITVNKSLAPNATYKITGQFILDTKGMTKEQIVKLGNIEGFVVNTKS
ncbi:hypothetical protein [Alicyclobacillus tolerans]|uniref:Uncharacterized protein n=1 Tax=Alicyclobacillus tolerans TaxID=90970 RepID=A0A1M6TL58_9BACL|nr:hypothetical protein [Alicyclobacillus montanus]SHK57674.1 hypothetical protein SAMN05443507_1176 [Alicyclobacillus montanus]